MNGAVGMKGRCHMGLAVEVGMLADLNLNDKEGASWLRKSLSKVNDVLAENNLPVYIEPEALPPLENRASLCSYPYSFLHHLRRFAAHAATKPKWAPKPFPKSQDPADDPVVADELAMLSSHLLCHSDSEGFYVPGTSASQYSLMTIRCPVACSAHPWV